MSIATEELKLGDLVTPYYDDGSIKVHKVTSISNGFLRLRQLGGATVVYSSKGVRKLGPEELI